MKNVEVKDNVKSNLRWTMATHFQNMPNYLKRKWAGIKPQVSDFNLLDTYLMVCELSVKPNLTAMAATYILKLACY